MCILRAIFHFIIFSFAPVAQPDRAADYESAGWGFKSLRARLEKEIVEKILQEEYETFSKIYKSLSKKEMPKISLDEIVEECFLASHEEIVKGNERGIIRAFSLSFAARILQRLKREIEG